MSDDLEPIAPREAVNMWLDRLQSTRADETLKSYRYRLKPFVQWCDEQGIDNLNQLTSRDIFQYDSSRRAKGLKVSTLNNQIGTLKQFIQFCTQIDAVEQSLPAKIEVPSVNLADRVNEELLTAERAETIRENLRRYERASRRCWSCWQSVDADTDRENGDSR